MELKLEKNGRSTTVGLIRNLNAIGHRFTVPQRRMQAALRRIGANSHLDCVHDAIEIWPFHNGYFVSYEVRP